MDSRDLDRPHSDMIDFGDIPDEWLRLANEICLTLQDLLYQDHSNARNYIAAMLHSAVERVRDAERVRTSLSNGHDDAVARASFLLDEAAIDYGQASLERVLGPSMNRRLRRLKFASIALAQALSVQPKVQPPLQECSHHSVTSLKSDSDYV